MRRGYRELTEREALRRLGSVSLGRIVFTMQALPAIRAVNHLLDHGDVIIRGHAGASLAGGQVVAYEADEIDGEGRLEWSVTITGIAQVVEDPDEMARYGELLEQWAANGLDYIVRISPEIVTGYECS